MSRMAGIAAGMARIEGGCPTRLLRGAWRRSRLVGLRASRGSVASAPGTRSGRGAGRQQTFVSALTTSALTTSVRINRRKTGEIGRRDT